MKLFRIQGGVHPDDRKALAAGEAIRDIPLPPFLHVPLQQHIGAAARPVVKKGQKVRKGQLIADADGPISAPVHAPTSGTVVGKKKHPAHHPSGLPVLSILIEPDGEDRWIDLEPCADPFALPPAEVAKRVAGAGIVGMGGATFPSAVKLNLRDRFELDTLVINAAECEPYLTCDDRLMREQAAAVLDGVRIMAHALGVKKIIIGIENNKPDAQRAMLQAAAEFEEVFVVGLPTRYPMGSEKHLVQVLTGKETPARSLTAELGVVVHNVATAFAVHEALRHGKPLVSRVVTLSGEAMARPGNYRVTLGTPVSFLLEQAGGFKMNPARLISGGPMMGQPLPEPRAPVIKGSNGILALSAAEAADHPEQPCIRCASCVSACPCGLLPLEMAAHTRAGDLEGAAKAGLKDCIACGSCAYVCPAHIPLVQYFNYAKGELTTREKTKLRQMETKRLAEARAARMEKQKAAKKAAMAARKKAQAEKKKREAEAKAAEPDNAQAEAEA